MTVGKECRCIVVRCMLALRARSTQNYSTLLYRTRRAAHRPTHSTTSCNGKYAPSLIKLLHTFQIICWLCHLLSFLSYLGLFVQAWVRIGARIRKAAMSSADSFIRDTVHCLGHRYPESSDIKELCRICLANLKRFSPSERALVKEAVKRVLSKPVINEGVPEGECAGLLCPSCSTMMLLVQGYRTCPACGYRENR